MVLPTGRAWQRIHVAAQREARAVAAAVRTSMPGYAAWVYCTLGNAYQSLGNYSKALEHHKERLGIVPQRLIRVAEVPARPALPRPVALLLCNHQVLRVVLERFGKASQILIRSAEGAIHPRFPDSDMLCRGCNTPTQPCSAWKSARRLPPPWPRAALPRPTSQQLQQAELVSPTRASGQPSASLPCGCRHEQRPRTRPCARPSTP